MASEIPHQVKKSATGKPEVHYGCPACGATMKNKLARAGEGDNCPQCGAPHLVPGTASLAKLREVNRARREQEQRDKARREQERAEQREAERLRREEEARAAERARVGTHQYKVILIREGWFSSLLLSTGNVNQRRMERELNHWGEQGWRLSFQVAEVRRFLLFFKRESILVTMHRTIGAGAAAHPGSPPGSPTGSPQ